MMFVGIMLFFVVIVMTLAFGKRGAAPEDVPVAETLTAPALSGWELRLDRIWFWIAAAVLLIVIAYGITGIPLLLTAPRRVLRGVAGRSSPYRNASRCIAGCSYLVFSRVVTGRPRLLQRSDGTSSYSSSKRGTARSFPVTRRNGRAFPSEATDSSGRNIDDIPHFSPSPDAAPRPDRRRSRYPQDRPRPPEPGRRFRPAQRKERRPLVAAPCASPDRRSPGHRPTPTRPALILPRPALAPARAPRPRPRVLRDAVPSEPPRAAR
jgi:hypothetical protein